MVTIEERDNNSSKGANSSCANRKVTTASFGFPDFNGLAISFPRLVEATHPRLGFKGDTPLAQHFTSFAELGKHTSCAFVIL